MKDLNQILEELKTIEQTINSGKQLNEDELSVIVDKLTNAFDVAQGELNNLEETSLKTLQQEENEQ